MNLKETLDQIAVRFRKPNPDRLAWEQPLRAQLVRRLLILCGAGEISLLVLGFVGVVRSTLFPWIGFEALLFLLASAWSAHKGNVGSAATMLLLSLSHVAGFIIPAYGPQSPAPALLLPTIIISGLVIGGYFLAAWSMVCVAVLVWDSAASASWDTQVILFWCAAYAATAYLIWLFSSHLERLLEAASRSGEERRAAVVEERVRLAREIHDTLAQGFTGIVVQINAAEQIAVERDEETWIHLDKARALARRSLDEARRSILLLRSSDLREFDLLSANELEAVREGDVYQLPKEIENELLRIGQEAVVNAIRHSGATKIQVSLCYRPHKVTLRISDDGSGLMQSAPGLGMRGMEERMRRVQGQFEIIAQPKEGTTVCASVAI